MRRRQYAGLFRSFSGDTEIRSSRPHCDDDADDVLKTPQKTARKTSSPRRRRRNVIGRRGRAT